VETVRRRGDETQPIPTGDLNMAKQATTSAVWRLHLRYILLSVALNVLVAGSQVAYDIYNDRENTRTFLAEAALRASNAVQQLRAEGGLSDREVLRAGAQLTGCELALISTRGQVFMDTTPRMGEQVRAMGWPGPGTRRGDTRMLIQSQLGELSGLWWLGEYDDRFDLLIIVPRRPLDEGRFQYITFAAGITGVSMIAMLVILLLTSHWMLRRPLVKLIDALTDALVRDVRRRKQAESRAVQARLEAERHLRFLDDLLNASEEVAIVAADQHGTVNLINRVAERILRVEAGEVIGKVTLDVLLLSVRAPDAEESGRDTLRPFVRRVDGEQRIVDRAGGEHVIQVSTSPIMDHEGTPAGTLVIFTDITVQRRVEAELRSKQMQLIQSSRMATLGEMAAGVAHEINQPLNNIGLLSTRASRLLQRKPRIDDDDAAFLRERLASIQDQVGRAAKIIDHLRVFGRAEPTQLEVIDVGQAVKGTLTLLGEQLRLHDIALDVDVPEGLPRAWGDVSRLEQVLINLIVNARFALDEQAERCRAEAPPASAHATCDKRLSIRCKPGTLRGSDAAAVLVEVEDNGPGMPEAVASRVFEPFYTTKEVGKGTGLGLSISYGIVREFGGTLSVRTAPGQGTTFTVALKQAGAEGAS
jgi:PAS domain S-box-containing protein